MKRKKSQTLKQLEQLEKMAQLLTESLGRFTENYDSAQTTSALGHVSQALSELRFAKTVRRSLDAEETSK